MHFSSPWKVNGNTYPHSVLKRSAPQTPSVFSHAVLLQKESRVPRTCFLNSRGSGHLGLQVTGIILFILPFQDKSHSDPARLQAEVVTGNNNSNGNSQHVWRPPHARLRSSGFTLINSSDPRDDPLAGELDRGAFKWLALENWKSQDLYSSSLAPGTDVLPL